MKHTYNHKEHIEHRDHKEKAAQVQIGNFFAFFVISVVKKGHIRVGITATGLFLRRNGWRLTAANQELESFTLAVAQSAMSFAQISAWLRFHTVSISQA